MNEVAREIRVVRNSSARSVHENLLRSSDHKEQGVEEGWLHKEDPRRYGSGDEETWVAEKVERFSE